MLATRLVLHAPRGGRVGVLPAPLSWQASLPHNDVGALSVTYSSLADGGEHLCGALGAGVEIGLELSFGGEWFEPDGARFVGIGRRINPADVTGALTLTLPSYGWLASRARNLALDLLETDGDFAGQRLYQEASAGAILRSQLDEYASRHVAAPALGWAFDAEVDSAGEPWTDRRTIPYEVGVDAKSILAGLASMGMCDWRTIGRDLALYVADSQTADLSGSVRLDLGRDIDDAPSDESLEDTAGYWLVRGDGQVVTTVTEPDAPSAWGVWEGYLSASGATTEAEAQAAVERDIERRSRASGQYTRQLVLSDEAAYLPFRDYGPGDVISALAVTEQAAMRVQQVTLSMDGQGALSGSVILNDRLVPAALRTSRRVTALLSGAALSGTGTPLASTDQRTPAAPTGLELSEQRYQDELGVWRSTISASWRAVTASTGATDMRVGSYALHGRPEGGQWRQLTVTDGALATAWQPFDAGTTWDFAVTATGLNGHTSAYSMAVQWTFGADDTPPPAPSAASLTVRLGALLAAWDGLDHTGAPMPSDWKHTEVHLSAVPGFAPSASTLIDVISSGGGGQVPIFDLAYGTTYFVKLVAVDFTGNRSPASAEVSGVPVRVVRTDIADGAVGDAQIGNLSANKITTGQLGAGIVDAIQIKASQITSGTSQADVQIAGTFYSLADAGQVSIHGGTIKVLDEVGGEQTVLAPGDSVFRGTADLETASVSEALQITNGATVTLEAGTHMVLSGGVLPPSTAPTAASAWPMVQMGADPYGQAANPGGACRAADGSIHTITAPDGWGNTAYSTYSAAGVYAGTHVVFNDVGEPYSIQGGTQAFWRRPADITILGGDIYLLMEIGIGTYNQESEHFTAPSAPSSYTIVRASDGETLASVVTYSAVKAARTVDGYTPPRVRLDSDGTYLVTGWVDASSKEVYKQWSIAGALIATRTNTAAGTGYAPWAISAAKVDVATGSPASGGTLCYLQAEGAQGRVRYTRHDTSVYLGVGAEWAQASPTTIALGVHAGVFWSIDTAGRLYTHDGAVWTDTGHSRTGYACHTWYDSIGTVHETDPGPARSVTLAKRARYQVTTTAIPASAGGADAVNSARIYVGASLSTMYLQTNTAGQSYSTASTSTYAAWASSGTLSTAPKTPFPATSLSSIESANGAIAIRSDGTGSIPAGLLTEGPIDPAVTVAATHAKLILTSDLATSGSSWKTLNFSAVELAAGALEASTIQATVTNAGVYMVAMSVVWSNTAHRRLAEVRINGNTVPGGMRVELNASGYMSGGAGGLVPLAAGDQVSLAYYAAGGTLQAASLSLLRVA